MTAPVLERHQGDIHLDVNPVSHQRRFITAMTEATNTCVALQMRPVSIAVRSCKGLTVTVQLDSPDEVGTLAERWGLDPLNDKWSRGLLTFHGRVELAGVPAETFVYGPNHIEADE